MGQNDIAHVSLKRYHIVKIIFRINDTICVKVDIYICVCVPVELSFSSSKHTWSKRWVFVHKGCCGATQYHLIGQNDSKFDHGTSYDWVIRLNANILFDMVSLMMNHKLPAKSSLWFVFHIDFMRWHFNAFSSSQSVYSITLKYVGSCLRETLPRVSSCRRPRNHALLSGTMSQERSYASMYVKATPSKPCVE